MNKTISVQTFKRPERALDCLDRLSKVSNIEDYTVRVFADNAGHDEVFNEVMKHDLPDDGVFREQHLGLKHGNKYTIRDQFEEYGSDLNVHVEEDVLLGDDALRFIDWCANNIDLSDKAVALCKNSPGAEPGTVHQKTGYFHCWGWAITKDFYYNHFQSIEDDYSIGGWAGEVTNYFARNNLMEIYSAVQQAKNVAGPGEGENQWITKEGWHHKSQPYTGEQGIDSPDEWKFVGCLEERCSSCLNMKEFH